LWMVSRMKMPKFGIGADADISVKRTQGAT
jgi:hypothetical protein